MILMAMLGLNPNAKEQRLTLHQPTLPDWLNTLEIDELYIGKLRVHLRFERHSTHTEVIPGHYNQIDLNIIR